MILLVQHTGDACDPEKPSFEMHAAHKSESPSVLEWVLEEVKYVVA